MWDSRSLVIIALSPHKTGFFLESQTNNNLWGKQIRVVVCGGPQVVYCVCFVVYTNRDRQTRLRGVQFYACSVWGVVVCVMSDLCSHFALCIFLLCIPFADDTRS